MARHDDVHTIEIAFSGVGISAKLVCPITVSGREPTAADACRVGWDEDGEPTDAPPLNYCGFAAWINSDGVGGTHGGDERFIAVAMPVAVTWNEETEHYVWVPVAPDPTGEVAP